jgi:hypothetical protein
MGLQHIVMPRLRSSSMPALRLEAKDVPEMEYDEETYRSHNSGLPVELPNRKVSIGGHSVKVVVGRW